MDYREATVDDVEAIAGLHADSWRRNYRGAYSDAFLDGDVFADRLAVWTGRLADPGPDQCTLAADQGGEVVGFAHTVLHDDRTWGALLDNLHVRSDLKGRGIGSRLMSETATMLSERAPTSGLYLWVLQQNTAAQAFYAALGGVCVGRKTSVPPGGGSVVGLRYAWSDLAVLIARTQA